MSDINTECELCGSFDQVEQHHTSYEDDETMTVCAACHHKIHDSEKRLSQHQPKTDDYYTPDAAVDKSELPSREGWTLRIELVQCPDNKCTKCPHGPYYYYYRHTDTGFKKDYGGTVPPNAIMAQNTLDQYTTAGGE
jgi:hypothetical protein